MCENRYSPRPDAKPDSEHYVSSEKRDALTDFRRRTNNNATPLRTSTRTMHNIFPIAHDTRHPSTIGGNRFPCNSCPAQFASTCVDASNSDQSDVQSERTPLQNTNHIPSWIVEFTYNPDHTLTTAAHLQKVRRAIIRYLDVRVGNGVHPVQKPHLDNYVVVYPCVSLSTGFVAVLDSVPRIG